MCRIRSTAVRSRKVTTRQYQLLRNVGVGVGLGVGVGVGVDAQVMGVGVGVDAQVMGSTAVSSELARRPHPPMGVGVYGLGSGV